MVEELTAATPAKAARALSAAWIAVVLIGCAAAVWMAFRRAPVSFDDAYITFRYARSLARGHGLVFNLEDGPVEGFTNLLWVLINAVVERLGFDQLIFSQRLGLLALAVSLALLFDRRRIFAPRNLVAVSLVVSAVWMSGFVQVAGSGLETSFAGLLTILLGLALQASKGRLLLVVLAGGALIITRPDGALFLAAAVVAMSLPEAGSKSDCKELFRRALPYALAAVGLIAAVTVFRRIYFHSFVPNTYYAKSADVSSWASGFEYWRGFARNSPHIPALLVLWLAVLAFRRRLTRFDLFAGLGLLAYILYVAKVGGDFMFYRFGFQVTPLIFAALARAFDGWRAGKVWIAALVAAGIALFGARRPEALETKFGMQSVAVMNGFVEPGRAAGLALQRHLPANARISTTLAGTVPFYSGLFTIDEWGLSDKKVASRPSEPIALNSRGHLKYASETYLLERAVDLQVGHPTLCDCKQLCDSVGVPQVYIPLDDGRCLRTNYLSRNKEFRRFVCQSKLPHLYLDCEQLPQPLIRSMGSTKSIVAADGSVATRGSPLALEDLLISTHGAAFGTRPAFGALPGQTPVKGFSGALLNSFHGGDGTTGWIDFLLPAKTRRVHLRYGGGAACDQVFAALVAGDRVITRACGRNDETLRPMTLEVPPGTDEVRLLIVDNSPAPWGHLLVSNVLLEGD